MPSMVKQKVSVVIPVLNEIDNLPSLIKSIKRDPGVSPEIVVADAGSDDGSVAFAEREGCRVVQGGIPAVGRNRGASVASHERIVFLDADVCIRDGFISSCTRYMRRKGIDVGNVWAHLDCRNPVDHMLFEIWNLWAFGMQKIWPYAGGYCIFSTRRIHKRVGGFNERMHFTEDANYVKRCSRAGRFAMLPYSISTSNRRFRTEGRFGLAYKSVSCVLYRLMVGEPENNEFSYEFGTHDVSSRVRK